MSEEYCMDCRCFACECKGPVYIIGSLRNPAIPLIAQEIRAHTGLDVFDDWYAAGPEADDCWQRYEQGKAMSYAEALAGHAARNVFEFDKRHLLRSKAVVLVLPAGKSGHLELGWSIGKGKKGYVYFAEGEPERWDVMYQFADGVFFKLEDLAEKLK